MHNPFQANLRKPWLLLCTTALVTYTIMPARHETLFYFDAPSSVLEALMFLLSFPLGDSLMFLFHSAAHGVTERFVFWALAMGIGYAQWFHLFPALLRRRQSRATTLNLSEGRGVAPASENPLGLNEPAARAALEAERPPVPQFNERGLTPLERVFRDDNPER
ncbi:MAG: hypothetical protein DMF67_08135 [Acidobacteria bacterium]|nr:MAG: hypothetical protein DMF66_19765 [Acidobacteriota bacterium]PYS83629.1 MAG: hypothetical protein DMF67_08135 [Acidobacteriota bacterium]